MTEDNSTLTQYVLVRVTQDANEAPIDIERFVDSALHAAAFFRDDVRLTIREINEAAYEAARVGNDPDNDVSVHDFVSVTPLGSNLASVFVWEQDGESRQILRETVPTCSLAAQIIKDTLRTWDGWK